jgi:hypothetical protein
MTVEWFQGRHLPFNDKVRSRCVSVAPHNPTAPQQPASEGSSSGKVVDRTADGPSWSLILIEWGQGT